MKLLKKKGCDGTIRKVTDNEKINSEYVEYLVGKYSVEVTFEEGALYRCYARPLERYVPQIFYNLPVMVGEKSEFEIQTTSYGPLTAEEIQKVIEGYQHAVEVVKVLESEVL